MSPARKRRDRQSFLSLRGEEERRETPSKSSESVFQRMPLIGGEKASLILTALKVSNKARKESLNMPLNPGSFDLTQMRLGVGLAEGGWRRCYGLGWYVSQQVCGFHTGGRRIIPESSLRPVALRRLTPLCHRCTCSSLFLLLPSFLPAKFSLLSGLIWPAASGWRVPAEMSA